MKYIIQIECNISSFASKISERRKKGGVLFLFCVYKSTGFTDSEEEYKGNVYNLVFISLRLIQNRIQYLKNKVLRSYSVT